MFKTINCPNGHTLSINASGYGACPVCGAIRTSGIARDNKPFWKMPRPAPSPLEAAEALRAYLSDDAAFDCPDIVYCEIDPEPEARKPGGLLSLRIAFGGNSRPAEFILPILPVKPLPDFSDVLSLSTDTCKIINGISRQAIRRHHESEEGNA